MEKQLVDMFGNKIDKKMPATSGYDPGPRYMWFQTPRDLPVFTFRTVQYMLLDPIIRLGLAMRMAPLCSAEFAYKEQGQWVEGVKADKPEVKEFVEQQLNRLWKYDIDKVLTSQIWGWSACEVMWKRDDEGSYVYDTLVPRHARDVRALTRNGAITGVRFSRLTEVKSGQVDLQVPGKALWHSFNPESDSFYGSSILMGCYSPFADKWFNGGALDVRRLFMHADAYSGRRIWYPPGMTNIDGEGDVPNRDIARQIVEQIKSGEVQFLPSAYDENGNKLWNIEDPRVSNNPTHILQYPKDVDVEMLRGLEIADDVITSQGMSGSWQGKQVPMQAFYSGLNRWGISVLRAVIQQVIEPAVMWKFHKAEEFEAALKPLDVQAMEIQQGAGGPQGQQGAEGGQQQPPGMGGPPMAPPPSMADASGFGGGEQEQSGPFSMSLTAEEEVGRGVLSAADMVRAARKVMGEDGDESVNTPASRMDKAIGELSKEIGSTVTINTSPTVAISTNGNGSSREYASTHVEIPRNKSAELMKLIVELIDPADLTDKGFEPHHHITIKYGIQNSGLPQVEHVLRREPPVSARFGVMEFFSNPHHDVLWVSVESPSLCDMSRKISDAIPCADTHPQYVPHMTVAYLKPGTAHKYQGIDLMLGVQSFSSVTFSDSANFQTPVPLTGPMRMSLEVHSELSKKVASAASKTDRNPSPEDIVDGTYKKGSVNLHGFNIVIETPKGAVRSGIGDDGEEWSMKMTTHYGYIDDTIAMTDDDELDVFIGDRPESEIIFVMDQFVQVGQNGAGQFEEHKVFFGFVTEDDAREAYLDNYEKGWTDGPITALTVKEFQSFIDNGNVGAPIMLMSFDDRGSSQPPPTTAPIRNRMNPYLEMALEPGTRKTENGREYVLKDSRWHRVREDEGSPREKKAPEASKPKSIKEWIAKKFTDSEHVKNFFEWFGKSKAVDDNGVPLTLFHGTDRQFKSFKGDWIYLSDNPKFAEKFGYTDKPLQSRGEKVTLKFDHGNGPVEKTAYRTNIPGLVLQEGEELNDPVSEGGKPYTTYETLVVHENSGYVISRSHVFEGGYDDKTTPEEYRERMWSQANDVLSEVGKIRVDWTGSKEDVSSLSKRTNKQIVNAIDKGKGAETAAMFGYKSGARGVGQGTNLVPVHIKMENPLDLTNLPARGVGWKQFYQGLRDAGLPIKDKTFMYGGGDLYQALVSEDINRVLRSEAINQGFDGVVFNDYYDDKTRGKSYIIFDPSQAKSATGNRGTYSPHFDQLTMALEPGTRKREDGRDYVLKDSRWHRVSEAESDDHVDPSEETRISKSREPAKVKLSPAQRTEIESGPLSTLIETGEKGFSIKGNSLVFDNKEAAAWIARALSDDYESPYGLEGINASRRRSMMKLLGAIKAVSWDEGSSDPQESKIPGKVRKSQVTKARKSLGSELSKKIARQKKDGGGEVDLTVDEVEKILKHGIVGFVSAGRNPENKADVDLSDEQIEERYESLQDDLIRAGYRYSRVMGKYGEEEDSFLVMAPEADKETLLRLGAKYNQDSVLYSVGNQNELVFTSGPNKGMVHPGTGHERVPDAEDFFTVFEGVRGRKMKFTLGLDFEKMEHARLAIQRMADRGWVRYDGEKGGKGWQDSSNPSDIRYQEEKPSDRGEGEEDGDPRAKGEEDEPGEPSGLEEGEEGEPGEPSGEEEESESRRRAEAMISEVVAELIEGATMMDPRTPPPPGDLFYPDVEVDLDGDGVTDYARVGVPASLVPPPPDLVPVPHLNPNERQAETEFMQAFAERQEEMTDNFINLMKLEAQRESEKAGGAFVPPTFETDAAKSLYGLWNHEDEEERLKHRSTLNVALHQVANAVAKKAFVKHLDTLKPGDQVLVTSGGCGAGKGWALGFVDKTIKMKKESKAVWDAAGDQNATENPWIQKELDDRNLKGVYVFMNRDPRSAWSHEKYGVVKRASNKSNGRMVDAQVFADSYAIGAKNHQAFYEKNVMNENAQFVFLQYGNEVMIEGELEITQPKEIPGIPDDALGIDRHELARYAMEQVMTSDAPERVKAGATVGSRIWGYPKDGKTDEAQAG